MALGILDAARVFRSAIGVLDQRGRLLAEGALTRRLMAANPGLPGGIFQAYQAIARQARLAFAAGRALRGTVRTRPSGRGLPIDPSIGEGDPRYQYRVVVVWGNGTPQRVATSVNVTSETALNRGEIEAAARSQFEVGDTPGRAERAAIRAVPRGAPLEFTITSAGRRA